MIFLFIPTELQLVEVSYLDDEINVVYYDMHLTLQLMCATIHVRASFGCIDNIWQLS